MAGDIGFVLGNLCFAGSFSGSGDRGTDTVISGVDEGFLFFGRIHIFSGDLAVNFADGHMRDRAGAVFFDRIKILFRVGTAAAETTGDTVRIGEEFHQLRDLFGGNIISGGIFDRDIGTAELDKVLIELFFGVDVLSLVFLAASDFEKRRTGNVNITRFDQNGARGLPWIG